MSSSFLYPLPPPTSDTPDDGSRRDGMELLLPLTQMLIFKILVTDRSSSSAGYEVLRSFHSTSHSIDNYFYSILKSVSSCQHSETWNMV
ncbi:hypothetical protein J6590_067210 [Homalodisca vitripennis]|nr:hypothetical protein J6590_067210 [Homalodisca vitripennis]